MSMYIPDKYLRPRKCPVCGRFFIMHDAEQWAYKRKPGDTWLYFCRWSCLRKYDREHPVTGGSRGKGREEDDW